MAISRDEVRESLPATLRPTFDRLVEEYRYHTTVIHGRPFVSYAVLAALVREGWRPSDDAPPCSTGDSTPRPSAEADGPGKQAGTT